MVKKLLTEQFESATQEGVTLIDFYADWCGPCRRLSPIIESVSKQVSPNADIYKVNIDESGALARRFGIRSVPTLLLFKDGVLVNSVSGLQSEKTILRIIKSAL
tara:strand:+ start:171 stop:482 length:312 start_codon:yes stop_codon:yes gene_type:complete